MLKKLKQKQIIRLLKTWPLERIEEETEKKLLLAVKNISRRVPFYRNFFEKIGLDPQKINTLKEFKEKVPIFKKEDIFSDFINIEELIPGGLDNFNYILLSSGHSGHFSFGLSNLRETKETNFLLEALLDYNFKISKRKTLLINALAWGVKISPGKLILVDTGPRIDSLCYLLKTFSPKFEQSIILAEGTFIKNALEEAKNSGINLRNLKINLILGGTFLPESLREYLGSLLDLAIDKNPHQLIVSSLGISEFGLNIFHETYNTIRLRRRCLKEEELRRLLFLKEIPFYPSIFLHYPRAFYVEEIAQKIVITSLRRETGLFLLRYNTQDKGYLIDFKTLKDILEKTHHQELQPEFRLPLVIVYGRDTPLSLKDRVIFPTQIQEIIYDRELAYLTTGYFYLSSEGNRLRVELQLKKDITPHLEIKKKFERKILGVLNIEGEILLYRYRDFPYGMDIDYLRKFKYLSS